MFQGFIVKIFLALSGVLSLVLSFLWKRNKDLETEKAVLQSKNQEFKDYSEQLQTQAKKTVNQQYQDAENKIEEIRQESDDTISQMHQQLSIANNTAVDNNSVLNWLHKPYNGLSEPTIFANGLKTSVPQYPPVKEKSTDSTNIPQTNSTSSK